MSRRTKLITLGIFLLLLVIPVWHVASNWAPANPLRFRLVSRQRVPDEDGLRRELLEIEVLNTGTASTHMGATFVERTSVPIEPLRLGDTFLRSIGSPGDPFAPRIWRPGDGTVIPAGGTWRSTVGLVWPKGDSTELGPVEITYAHASTIRYRVVSWYQSLCLHLPLSQQRRLSLDRYSDSTALLEAPP